MSNTFISFTLKMMPLKKIFYIQITSINKKNLLIFLKFLQKLFMHFNFKFITYSLPTKSKKITLLRSPHVYKKSREQFELNTFRYIICIKDNLLPEHLKFLLLNKPGFIKIKISTKIII